MRAKAKAKYWVWYRYKQDEEQELRLWEESGQGVKLAEAKDLAAKLDVLFIKADLDFYRIEIRGRKGKVVWSKDVKLDYRYRSD